MAILTGAKIDPNDITMIHFEMDTIALTILDTFILVSPVNATEKGPTQMMEHWSKVVSLPAGALQD